MYSRGSCTRYTVLSELFLKLDLLQSEIFAMMINWGNSVVKWARAEVHIPALPEAMSVALGMSFSETLVFNPFIRVAKALGLDEFVRPFLAPGFWGSGSGKLSRSLKCE